MTPRLKSSIWVEAFMRQANAAGQFCTVLHKGNAEAGQICILFSRQDQQLEILSPPPGPAHDDDGNRRFELAFAHPIDWMQARDWLAKIRGRDPDVWVIEVEARDGFSGLTPEKI